MIGNMRTLKTMGVSVLAGVLLGGGLAVCNAFNAGGHDANAADKPQPYVTASMSKIMDGTGWNDDGKPMKGNHTFIQKANGFQIGDDSPTDGVVASGDTVQYTVQLNFMAAKERTIRVRFDSQARNDDGKSYLELASGDGSTFCSSTPDVSASWVDRNNPDGGCDYHVGAGVSSMVRQTVYLRARDTGGTVRKNNAISMNIARLDGGSDFNVNGDDITVVSSPSADLLFENGADPHNSFPSERRTGLQQNGDATGHITIKPVPVQWTDWNRYGSSSVNAWASADSPAVVDVSAFPDGTVFTMDGSNTPLLTVSHDGRNPRTSIVLTTYADNAGRQTAYSGEHELHWRIPASVFGYSCVKNTDRKRYDCSMSPSLPSSLSALKSNGGYAYLPISIKPGKGAFATHDQLLNMGIGGEPGWDGNRDDTTRNDRFQTLNGSPYANNDYTRAVIYRYDPWYQADCDETGNEASCYYWHKDLERPYAPGKTIYDDEGRRFEKDEANGYHASSEGGSTVLADSSYSVKDRNVAQDTMIRVNLNMGTQKGTSCGNANGTNTCRLAVSDTWNPSVQMFHGNLNVYKSKGTGADENRPLDPRYYTVQWSSYDFTDSATASNNGQLFNLSHPVAVDDAHEWHDGVPSEPDWKQVRSIRVIMNGNVGIADGDEWHVRFDMLETAPAITDDNNKDRIPTLARDCMDGSVGKRSMGGSCIDYNVLKPGAPSAGITNGIRLSDLSLGGSAAVKCDTTDDDGTNDACNANPGYRADYLIHPSYGNIAYSDADLTPTVTIDHIPAGLIDFQNDTSGNWDAAATADSKGNITKLVFTLKADADGNRSIKPSLDANRNGAFPDIRWHATVSNRATGTITTNAELTYTAVKANAKPPYVPKPATGKAPAAFQINKEASSSGSLKAGNTVEVNDGMSWSYNIYSRGSDYAKSDSATTVIRMPESGKDANMGGADRSGKADCKTTVNNTVGINDEKYPGLDCSWHEYDRGVSEYEGGWLIKANKDGSDPNLTAVKRNNSTDVSFMYAVETKAGRNDANTDDPSAFKWLTWDEYNALNDDRKEQLKAIKITAAFDRTTNSALPVAAANGSVTITPAGGRNHYGNHNHSGDVYTAWIGRNYIGQSSNGGMTFGKPQNTQPWADSNKVIAGTLSGTTWWDDSDDSYMDDGEPRIPDAQVRLFRKADVDFDADGRPVSVHAGAKALRAMNTWEQSDVKTDGWKADYADAKDADGIVGKPWKGGYKFIELHSDDYVAMVKRADNAGKTDGNNVQDNAVPMRIDASQDYYSTERKVENTYAFDNDKRGVDILGGNSDASDAANVSAGGDRNRVDFGYYAPHPLVSLNKQMTNKSCVGKECKVQWAVTIRNDGNTTVRRDGARITDTMSDEVKDVNAYMSTLKKGRSKVFTDGEHSMVLSNGRLTAWGYNRYGQSGQNPGEFPTYRNGIARTPTQLDLNGVTSADTGSMHSAAIANGKLYTWGLNTDGQLGNGFKDMASDQVPNPHPVPEDVTGQLAKSGAVGTPVQVAAGADYTVVIMSDGSMWSTTGCPNAATVNDGDDLSKDTKCTGNAWVRVGGNGDTYATTAGSLSAYGSTVAAVDGRNHNVVYNTGFQANTTSLRGNSGHADSAVQVAAGFDHVLALDGAGKVRAITSGGSFGQSSVPTDSGYVAISAGYMNSMAVKADGSVYAWGLDMYGSSSSDDYKGVAYENGQPSGKAISTPTRIAGLKANTTVSDAAHPTAEDIAANADIIAAGYSHALFSSDKDGEVLTTGLDAMGDGTNVRKSAEASKSADGSWDVYRIGTTSPSSIGKTKVYGADYVDTDNLTALGDCLPEGSGTVQSDADAPSCVNTGRAGTALNRYAINLPYDLPAGNQVTVVLEGVVGRNEAIRKTDNTYQAGASKYVVNQAWFTSADTPFERTPNARAHAANLVDNAPRTPSENVDDWDDNASDRYVAKPGHPDGSWKNDRFTAAAVQSKDGSRTGTNDVHDASFTCRAGYAFGEANEHWYGAPYRDYRYDLRIGDGNPELADGAVSASNEDMCDQQATIIEGFAKGAVFGSISGMYWKDSNGNGVRDKNEDVDGRNFQTKKGQNVTLWTVDGKGSLKDMIASTETDANGAYSFDDLPIDQNCEYAQAGAGGNDGSQSAAEGNVVRCSSLKYRVVFSQVVEGGAVVVPFTKTDARKPADTTGIIDKSNVNGYVSVGAADGNGAGFTAYGDDRQGDVGDDSDAITAESSKDKAGFSSFAIQWLNVDANQSKPHVDAGYGVRKVVLANFPFTGARWLLLVIAILIITACVMTKLGLAERRGRHATIG